MLQSSIHTVQALRKSRDDLIQISEKNVVWDCEEFEDDFEYQKMDLEIDQFVTDNTLTPAKHRLFARQMDELNALHVKEYAERLAVHDQWRADPWYIWRHLRNTVLRTQHAKHGAEYTQLMKRHRRQLVHTSEYQYEVEQGQSRSKKRTRADIGIQ